MRSATKIDLYKLLRNKRVAIVGSAPSCAQNEPGFIDDHDVVIRINNYKLGFGQGFRADVHYSFYGNSIKKTADELRFDGVWTCMCKCPDANAIDSEWHRRNGKTIGTDFRWIYRMREHWWPAEVQVYVPELEDFLVKFETLERHIPSTGAACIMDVLEYGCREIYITGFDFFRSGKHNVDEPWRPGREDDPIGHRPDLELAWLRRVSHAFPLRFDPTLKEMVNGP